MFAPLRDWFRHSSIRTKLVTINLATTAVALLVMGALVIANDYVGLRKALQDDADARVRMIADSANAALVFADPQGARNILAALKASPGVLGAELYGSQGNLLAAYARDAQGASVAAARLDAVPGQTSHVFAGNLLDTRHPVVVNGSVVGAVVLRTDLAIVYKRLGWYGAVIAVAAGLAATIAYLMMSWLQWHITGPLLRLAGMVRDISGTGNYSRRFVREERDEIGVLVNGVNEMLEQIEQRDVDLELELGQRSRAEQRLDQLAHYDMVTGLPNRNYFGEHLGLVIEKVTRLGGRAALLFFDLDNFKLVNDTLGHNVGDRLLNAIARRLEGRLRHGDLLCRVGGDEFALLIGSVKDSTESGGVADKTLAALAQPFDVEGQEIFVGASCGIAVIPDDGREVPTILRHAETAMYAAKEMGKNTYQFFRPEMKERTARRLTIETQLRRALDRDELMLYYQPQYVLGSQRVAGAEALLRWRHPALGVVQPAEFVAVAEETGLIVPIGQWALRTACVQARAWVEGGSDLTVSVNVAVRQFQESDFVERVLATLRETGLEARHLALELTESALLDSSSATVEKLKRLSAASVQLAIDDFGTGYSSMSYLKRLPISSLKIDRSFVSDIPNDQDGVAITSAILAMGQSLRLKMIAEGVETQEQAEFLAQHHCHSAQGHYFAGAMPADGLTKVLEFQRGGVRARP